MNTAKQEVEALIKNLPDDSTLEDFQYHLYVMEKIQRGINRAEQEGTLDQQEAERKLRKWIEP